MHYPVLVKPGKPLDVVAKDIAKDTAKHIANDPARSAPMKNP
jgi:hypothetical protein